MCSSDLRIMSLSLATYSEKAMQDKVCLAPDPHQDRIQALSCSVFTLGGTQWLTTSQIQARTTYEAAVKQHTLWHRARGRYLYATQVKEAKRWISPMLQQRWRREWEQAVVESKKYWPEASMEAIWQLPEAPRLEEKTLAAAVRTFTAPQSESDLLRDFLRFLQSPEGDVDL